MLDDGRQPQRSGLASACSSSSGGFHGSQGRDKGQRLRSRVAHGLVIGY